MSKRSEQRADRIYRFWRGRLESTTGTERAEAAFDYLRARVKALPVAQQETIFNRIAEELITLAETGSDQQVHTFTTQRAVNPGNSLRAQPRAGA